MFYVHCPAHGRKVLLDSARIRGLVNVRGAIVVELECHDGERVLHITGRRVYDSAEPAALRAQVLQPA